MRPTLPPALRAERLRRVLIAGDVAMGLALATAILGRSIWAFFLIALAWGCVGVVLSNLIRSLQEPRP